MTNLIAGLLAVGGVLAYLYGLWNKYQQGMQKIARAEAQATVKTDLEKVAQDATNVKETTVDFAGAVDNFNKNNTGPK